jgi:hypothetical protein
MSLFREIVIGLRSVASRTITWVSANFALFCLIAVCVFFDLAVLDAFLTTYLVSVLGWDNFDLPFRAFHVLGPVLNKSIVG